MTARTIGLLMAAAVLLPSCGLGQEEGDPDQLTAKVEQGDLAIEIELTGSFVADEKDEIRMEPSAYRGDLIITSLVAEGQKVKKGDVLIEFDPSSLEDALEDATDDVEAKTVELEKANAEMKAWQLDEERKTARRTAERHRASRDLDKAKEMEADVLADKKRPSKTHASASRTP